VHIAFVTHAYPRRPDDVAGNFLHRLAVALAAVGHRTTVIAPADRGAGGLAVLDGVSIHRVRYAQPTREDLAYTGTMVDAMGTLSGKIAAVRMLAALRAGLRRLHRDDPPDVVHAHWWIPGGLAAATAGAPARPFIVTLHGTDVRLLGRGRALRFAGRQVLQRAAAVTAVSGALADRAAAAAALPRERVRVQPMPLDVDRFTRTTTGGDGTITVGRLTNQKRVHLIIDAVALLKRRGRNIRLTVIGDGAERGRLEQHARNAGCEEAVRFCGAVAPQRLPNEMGDPDVFAFAGLDEGLGLAVAEAYLLGVPVVAMDGGGGVMDLMASPPGGRIVADGDVDGFADALASVVEDPEARAAAAAHGSHLRNRFSPERTARAYDAVYHEALGR
jgi:glycosyltransferase involved in cell wall biosynthesis